MSNQKPTLTASNIRYLLVLNELDRDGAGAKSSDVAKCLGVSKPSVCTTIKRFCEKGYVTKEKYEAVHLTIPGRGLAQRYAKCFSLLYSNVQDTLGLSPEDCRNAACAVLSQTREHGLDALYEKLRVQASALM